MELGQSTLGEPGHQRETPARRRLLEAVIESATVGLAVICGVELVFELANATFQALLPLRVLLGQTFEEAWPEAAERILPILQQVIDSGVSLEAIDVPVEIQRSPGGPLELAFFSFACRRLPGLPGEAPAVLMQVLDTTQLVLARRDAESRARSDGVLFTAEHDAREEAERARDRFERLARLIAEVNEEPDLEAVMGTALRLSVSLLGADDGVLRLVEEGGSSVRAFAEVQGSGRTGRALALDHLPHSREAAETGRGVHFTIAEARGSEAENLRSGGHASCLVLPLALDQACFGFMEVEWRAGVERGAPPDGTLARDVADQCALAISRAWVLESERVGRVAAERVSRRQEMLSAILAHDLRSPIQAIAATSKALISRDGLDERQVDAVGRIATIAGRMEDLVEELLDLARVRHAGGIPVERERTDIELICARAIRGHLDSHPDREVAFTLSGPGEGLWDPSRLEQLVSNLVGNALARAPAGAAVEVRAAATADELVLTVRNEGPVIPADVLVTLFEPFRRGDRRGSIGLGLFIAREIVRAHGGDIGATSDHADGTRFTVRLPRFGTEA